MRIGYACLTVGVRDTKFSSVMMKNATPAKLTEIIERNLHSLHNIIDYNIENNIKLFRISSEIIPFGSSPVNTLPWWDIFADQLEQIGSKALNNSMRLSMHPGQYTVLNSPRKEVVENAICDLRYHTKFLESLGAGPEHKIVLHIGGIYNNKKEAAKSFMANFSQLDKPVKERLIIENDARSYNIEDVTDIGTTLNIPVVFDNLHHLINPGTGNKDELYWIQKCAGTWPQKDGPQKIHYSQQAPDKKPGAHTTSIYIDRFMAFYNNLSGHDTDIMLEVKDKNLSAVKCINCTTGESKIQLLEKEWARYKYKILESSPETYRQIRKLLSDKNSYPALLFYQLIEKSLQDEVSVGQAVNSAQHIWGYFKDVASDAEKAGFIKSISAFEKGDASISPAKNKLYKLAVKYNCTYLLDSYYFVF